MGIELFQIESGTKRYTYTIWLRFIALAAVLAVAFAVFGQSSLFTSNDSSLPWYEESRILQPGQIPQAKPSDNQPQLTRVLRYKTEAEYDAYSRGTVNLLIYPDGTVKGVWNGEYNQPDDIHRLIMAASFAGNTDPSKPCLYDPNNLYFITRGTYTLLETQLTTGRSRGINGYIYVCGWMAPDYGILGELTITENKKSFDTFSWSAYPKN